MVNAFYKLFTLKTNRLCSQKNVDGYWRQHGVKKYLESNFKNSRERVLIFYDLLTKEICKKSLDQRLNINRNVVVEGNIDNLDWPCSARRKAVAITEVSHVIKNYAYYSR